MEFVVLYFVSGTQVSPLIKKKKKSESQQITVLSTQKKVNEWNIQHIQHKHVCCTLYSRSNKSLYPDMIHGVRRLHLVCLVNDDSSQCICHVNTFRRCKRLIYFPFHSIRNTYLIEFTYPLSALHISIQQYFYAKCKDDECCYTYFSFFVTKARSLKCLCSKERTNFS